MNNNSHLSPDMIITLFLCGVLLIGIVMNRVEKSNHSKMLQKRKIWMTETQVYNESGTRFTMEDFEAFVRVNPQLQKPKFAPRAKRPSAYWDGTSLAEDF